MSSSNAGTFDRIASPYDRGMAPLERLWLRRLRGRLLPWARGDVLEVGVGTGVNLPLYPAGVQVTAIDESVEMLNVAQGRAHAVARHSPSGARSEEVRSTEECGAQPTHLAQMDAERLAFPDGAFDTVVTSLVLCSVVDQPRALGELRRVLGVPAGRLLLLEHVRPSNPLFALFADLANLPWYAFNGRCHLNRRTEDAVRAAGFSVEHVETAAGGVFRLIVARRVKL